MAQNLTASILFFAIAGGFIPSLLWLWFWLKEDSNPEPRTNPDLHIHRWNDYRTHSHGF